MKGFEADYSGDKEQEPVPRPGTIAYLRYIEKEKERKAQSADKTEEPTKPGLALRNQDVKMRSPLERTPTLPSEEPLEPVLQVDLHEVEVIYDFLKFHNSIFRAIPGMTEGEIKLYLYLIHQSFGKDPPVNYCEYTQRDAMVGTGINSASTISKAMSVLERKGLVAWHTKATKRGLKSLVRVYLPVELENGPETTDLRKKKLPSQQH